MKKFWRIKRFENKIEECECDECFGNGWLWTNPMGGEKITCTKCEGTGKIYKKENKK